jgi:hypothetical protein
VPLDLATPSRIGDTYLTDTGLSDGVPMHVEWVDAFLRHRKVKSAAFADDFTPYESMTGVGSKGFIKLLIPSCCDAPFTALRTKAAAATHYTAVLRHHSASIGTKTLEVSVFLVSAAGDGQYATADPVEGVEVVLLSYGAAA